MESSNNYTQRLIMQTSLADTLSDQQPAAYCHVVDTEGSNVTEVENIMASVGTRPVMLWGTHRPINDQFPAVDLQQVGKKFAHNPMQRNQVYRQYGELLGWELRTLGYSIINVPSFLDDAEASSESLAALWSGLRIEGVAMSAELPYLDDGVDWEHARYTLISGVPFVSIAHKLATEQVFSELMDDERFSGVACVSGLMDAGLSGDALVDEAVRLLDMGWNGLILDDLDDESAMALFAALAERDVTNQGAHEDSVKRLKKRFDMLELADADDRGKGFISLDRDSDYLLARRVLSHKLDIEDDYAFAERPSRWGSMVHFHYSLQVDGELCDENRDEGLRALLGKGQVIPGLEEALAGRRKGEEFSIVIPPEKAYGVTDEEQIARIPRNGVFLAPGQKLQLGATATIPREGNVIHGRIVEINDEEVVIDANHELAGKSLSFDVSILDVI